MAILIHSISFCYFAQAKFLDIISFNRYNGWYKNPGKINMITQQVVDEAIAWNTKHHKPVLMSEYGADTIEGLHLVNWFEFISHFKLTH